MDQLQFICHEELACSISDAFHDLDNEFGEVSIIAKYDDAKSIIKALLSIGHDIASIELHKEEFEEYWDEYILSLNFDGVWCEKFKRDTGYFADESDVIYIMDSCSSNVIPYCKSKNIYEVRVEKNDDYTNTCLRTGDSETVYISLEKDGTPLGFSKAWSTIENDKTCYSCYSHYSDNIDLLREVAKEFDAKL